MSGTILAKLGTVPQQLAAGDISSGAGNASMPASGRPHDDEKLGSSRSAKCYYYTGLVGGLRQAHNLINMAKWNTLPKNYQSAIITASNDAWVWTLSKYDYVNPPAMKRLLAAALTEIYAELSQTNLGTSVKLPRPLPQRRLWLAARWRSWFRQLPDAHAHAHLMCERTGGRALAPEPSFGITARMQFGLFGSAQASTADLGPETGQGFRDYLDYAIEAEALGFRSSFLVEHHFTGWNQVSATLMLQTALAMRTTTLRLGSGVIVLPWHNPVLLAEQAATLDLISNGRLDFGIGRGYRYNEFAGFRIPMEEAEPRFEESVEVMTKAFVSRERFSHHGKFWQFDNIVVEPPPSQKPHPPFWVAAGSEASIRRAAQRGFNLILDQYASPEQLRERIALLSRRAQGVRLQHGRPAHRRGAPDLCRQRPRRYRGGA